MAEKTATDYIQMQKAFYEDPKRSVEGIVGNYDYHENFPYETNLLYLNGDVRKPIFDDFRNRKAFDIACGEGRMIRRMRNVFGQGCDGADISEHMVKAARERCAGSEIYVTEGNNCGAAVTNAYDFGFCTISLQHIASYTLRSQIITDLTRIIKPDGKVTLQLLMSKHFPYTLHDHAAGRFELSRTYARRNVHASYFEDKFAAASTNSACDVVIGQNDIPAVVQDFQKHFHDVKVWFYDISLGRGLPGAYGAKLEPTHPNCHIADDYHGTHFVFLHGASPRKS